MMNKMLSAVIVRPFNALSRKLYATKMLHHPLKDMYEIVNGNTDFKPRYREFSASDFNVANLMLQIAPEFKIDGSVIFSSSIFIELHRIKSNFFV